MIGLAIVLDLDETLIHTIVSREINPDYEPVSKTQLSSLVHDATTLGVKPTATRPEIMKAYYQNILKNGSANTKVYQAYQNMMKRQDQTTRVKITKGDQKRPSDFKFIMGGQHYYVFVRRGLKQFLEKVFEKFAFVGVWTAADASYAKIIVHHIFTSEQISKLLFVKTRQYCVSDHIGYYKPLTKLYAEYHQLSPRNTIMFDNNASVMRYNQKNGLLAVNYKEDNLVTDAFLVWMKDVINDQLRKNTNIEKFVENVNSLSHTAYCNSLDRDSYIEFTNLINLAKKRKRE